MPITDVIKYEGDNQTFVWRHPAEDFNTGSQLIVYESQEAIFFLNGQALDSFGPGRHELETASLPILSSVAKIPTGGASPFHAEVYFVNLTEQMGIPWGTSSKVQFMEPEFGFPLSVGASGEMALAVRDPRRLLLKIVGTEAVLSQAKLLLYFKSFLQTRIKTHLAKCIADQRLSIFSMDTELEALSGALKKRLAPDFAGYGLELTQMLVTTIVRPEGDPIYEKFRALYFRQYADVRAAQIDQQVDVIREETEAKKTVIGAKAQAEKRSLEGYTYQQERGFDVAQRMAANEAVGEFANMGVGLGVMTGVGGAMGSVMTDALAQANGTTQGSGQANNPAAAPGAGSEPCTSSKFCPECGYRFTGTEKFCPECGTRRS